MWKEWNLAGNTHILWYVMKFRFTEKLPQTFSGSKYSFGVGFFCLYHAHQALNSHWLKGWKETGGTRAAEKDSLQCAQCVIPLCSMQKKHGENAVTMSWGSLMSLKLYYSCNLYQCLFFINSFLWFVLSEFHSHESVLHWHLSMSPFFLTLGPLGCFCIFWKMC